MKNDSNDVFGDELSEDEVDMAYELDDDDNIKRRQRKKRKAPKELKLQKFINQRHLSSSRTTAATQIISLAALMRDLAEVFTYFFQSGIAKKRIDYEGMKE
jgi:hypothetical protein